MAGVGWGRVGGPKAILAKDQVQARMIVQSDMEMV